MFFPNFYEESSGFLEKHTVQISCAPRCFFYFDENLFGKCALSDFMRCSFLWIHENRYYIQRKTVTTVKNSFCISFFLGKYC